jgi:hypothetical protein
MVPTDNIQLRTERHIQYHVLQKNRYIITLFPFFATSNWFYTYQANDFNIPYFTLGTRSLNRLWSTFFNMVAI